MLVDRFAAVFPEQLRLCLLDQFRLFHGTDSGQSKRYPNPVLTDRAGIGTNLDGIVEVDLQACTPYCVETFRVKQLADQLGIPYLAVETDYSQSDSGQLATRMEAFLEML